MQRTKDSGKKSALCLTLVPFAFHTSNVPSTQMVGTISQLLRTQEDQEVMHALVFVVAVAQKKDIAKRLAAVADLGIVG
jgi:hypothetical protein